MNGGLITRRAARALQLDLGLTDERFAAHLREAEISVEDDMTVDSEELSPRTLYRLANEHGYYIAADTHANDVLERFPWLDAGTANLVAQRACEMLGDCDVVGDQRSDSIDEAAKQEAETIGFVVDLHPIPSGTGFSWMGKSWTVYRYHRPGQGGITELRLTCSDGSTWLKDGSTWEQEVEPTPAT